MASTPGFEPGPHWWEARVLLPLHLSKTHKRLSLVPVFNCLTTLITVGCLKTDKTRFVLPFTSGPDHEQNAAILLHERLFILFYLFTCHIMILFTCHTIQKYKRVEKEKWQGDLRETI